MIACILAIAISWPFFHHKPKPETAIVISESEIEDDLQELATIKQDYPWMRPWVEPALDVINRLRSGKDQNTDNDLREMRYYMWQLEQMEQNTTT